ncbi:MAG: hypothetical protein EBZ48_17180, partial [Proteobacteria bacterium]|nr:hypothetical protein [Pseudomonadota bacterium]
RGLDYVFNRETFASGQDDDKKNALKNLRRSFEIYIGDVQLTVGVPDKAKNLSPKAPSDSADPADGAVSLSIKRIPAETPPKALFKSLVIARYKDIHDLLALRCKFASEGPPTAGGAGSGSSLATLNNNGVLVPADQKTNFWRDIGGAHQLLVRISTAGFRTSPQAFDGLFGIFLAETSDDPSKSVCDRLSTEGGKPSDIFALIDKNKGRDLALNANERIRSAFFLAERIAYGQFLGTMAQAEQYVQRSTAGSYSSLIKENLLSMIYGAAGTRELDLAMDRNNQELRNMAQELLYRYKAAQIEYPSVMSSALSQGGGGTEGNAMNGQ